MMEPCLLMKTSSFLSTLSSPTMILAESKKYACETCIKGHRSSTCNHIDRPLLEIKRRGRPVNQCNHCRELRKRKQVYIHCVCVVKLDNANPKKAACCCVIDADCSCWTPRKSAPKSRRRTDSTASEFRPVLPHSSTRQVSSSKIAHGYPEGALLGSDNRAYDITFPQHFQHPVNGVNTQYQLTLTGRTPQQPQTSDYIVANSIPLDPTNTSSYPAALAPPNITFPFPCGCGDGCSCPGCYSNTTPSSLSSPSLTCQEPTSCRACLDCTILSLPPNDALSIPESQQEGVIDEWIRQMSTASEVSPAGGQLTGWNDLPQLYTSANVNATFSRETADTAGIEPSA